MATPTISQIILMGKVSRVLANQDIAQRVLFNKPIDNPLLPYQLWVLTKDVEAVYNSNPNYDGLQEVAQLLFTLCNPNAVAFILGGGGSVPVNPVDIIKSPIMITGANFASALSWTGSNSDNVNVLSSYTLQVFWNGLNRFLVENDEWSRTATGFDIIVNGTTITSFDATTTNLTDVFYIFISA